jgi:hypothetical protein
VCGWGKKSFARTWLGAILADIAQEAAIPRFVGGINSINKNFYY